MLAVDMAWSFSSDNAIHLLCTFRVDDLLLAFGIQGIPTAAMLLFAAGSLVICYF